MNASSFDFIGSSNKSLPAKLWLPDSKVCGVLQITHGMTEHIGRYEKLAARLTANGLAVAGFDLRGHGHNPGDMKIASLGECGWENSLQDMHVFYNELEARFPGVPHFMLGFSLGSFLLREYLSVYKDPVAGAIIMGTGSQPGIVLSIMASIIRTQVKKYGFDSSTPLVHKLSFETYNQRFKPNKTAFDWLCADETQLAHYAGDELCREQISSGLFWQLLCAMKRTGKADTCRKWDSKTPVLLISGEDDPVGDCGKGVKNVYKLLQKSGISDLEFKLYPGARHDLLHEESCGAADSAIEDIASWVEKH